jgi:hypothetical protein
MAKNYYTFDRPIKEISGEVLKQHLGDVKRSVLMRTIILNEKQFLKINYDRSLRSFWYITVKPTLDKLGLITEVDQTEEALTRWDAELSRYMGELVRLGELTYSDLNIVDTSRRRANPSNIYDIVKLKIYGYQVTSREYPNIIICTEKDTVYAIIEDIASFFGCSCISGKGHNSFSAMEDLLRGMGSTDKDIHILTMTDYDPAGYYIADTFKKQVKDLRESLEITGDVNIERIGIFPSQLTPEELEMNKYTPKKNNRDKWFKATGGINGKPKGLELDALEPDRIRNIFVTCLKKYIDPHEVSGFIKYSLLQKIILEAMAPKVEDIIDEITYKEVQNVNLSVDIDTGLFKLAEEGHDSLPIDALCNTDRQKEIKEAVLSYFK